MLTARLAAEDAWTARWELARTYLLLGDADRAVSEFERLRQQAPEDVEVLRHLALAEAKTGHLEVASTHLEAAIRLDPNYSEAYRARAEVYAVLDRDDAVHERARRTWEDLLGDERLLITTNYVALETAALVQHRLGMEAVRVLM
ncbi:MAG: tetratricopeptide repeat protein, partial [Akkermansiaceae bacterium]|nr:tetratricopeptide repeat protein [Akkermansiaceae bacterium]